MYLDLQPIHHLRMQCLEVSLRGRSLLCPSNPRIRTSVPLVALVMLLAAFLDLENFDCNPILRLGERPRQSRP